MMNERNETMIERMMEKFEIDISNGMTLKEIFDGKSDKEICEFLNVYMEYVKDYGIEEYEFYEEGDIEFLKKYGFEELIGN